MVLKPVRIAVYREELARDAGWQSGQVSQRILLWAGPGLLLPMRRDWERASVAQGAISGGVKLKASTDLTPATLVVVEGREYVVRGVVLEGDNDWVIYYAKRV